MGNPVVEGFRRLLQFGGRDRRGQFWPYAAVIFVLWMGIGQLVAFAAMSPLMAGGAAVGGAVPRFSPAALGAILLANAAAYLAYAGFMAAAVVRRLHDRNMSGLWGLLPLPFMAFTLFAFWRLFSAFLGSPQDFPLGMWAGAFLGGILHVVAVIILIVLLALPGSSEPNRFGDPVAPPA